MLGAGAFLAWKTAAVQARRRQLQHGQICELHSLWLDVNGCRMHARVSTAAAGGAALPVVLVHGWGVSSSYFIPTAERLAVRFAVYAPDLPGHGKSGTPAEPPDIGDLAQALLDWMDRAAIPRASVVGQSMGCQVAVEAALRQPGRIDRLVLIGPAPDPAARTMPTQLQRLLRAGLHEKPSLLPYLVRDYLRMGLRILPELRAMMHYPIECRLPSVGMPAMLVRGEHDTLAPQAWMDQAAALLNAAGVAVIPSWGHAVQHSAPEQLVRVLEPFLAGECAGIKRSDRRRD